MDWARILAYVTGMVDQELSFWAIIASGQVEPLSMVTFARHLPHPRLLERSGFHCPFFASRTEINISSTM